MSVSFSASSAAPNRGGSADDTQSNDECVERVHLLFS